MTTTALSRIAELNDQFRLSITNGPIVAGHLVLTPGVVALGTDAVGDFLEQVSAFKDFTEDNDPYNEHDFGSFEIEQCKIFWKIDYYDRFMENGSENPADPEETTRVLTLMLASEY